MKTIFLVTIQPLLCTVLLDLLLTTHLITTQSQSWGFTGLSTGNVPIRTDPVLPQLLLSVMNMCLVITAVILLIATEAYCM